MLISKTTLSPEEMMEIFKGTMVGFVNWRRAVRDSWPIDVAYIVDNRTEVAPLRAPWLRDRATQKEGRQWPQEDATFPTIGSIHEELHQLAAIDRDKAFNFVLDVERLGARVNLSLPATTVGRGPIVLMDGVHRSLGCMMTGNPFTIALHVLRCPRGASPWYEEAAA